MRIALGKNYHFHGCKHERLQDLEDQGFPEEMLMKVGRWLSTHAMKFYQKKVMRNGKGKKSTIRRVAVKFQKKRINSRSEDVGQ